MTATITAPTTEHTNWATEFYGLVLGAPTAEWNHSCTAQCPNPCPASSLVTMPEIDITASPIA